ncbi:hypothetical protein ALP97_100766 [Pseudomonas salomonii]|uniref:Uncharacterized protein n=1 Tax=Pseudomonas salomonii TaxID=191391 RepID=A0A3M4PZ46_9PSED|nr:hypothetical protein ALP97_100766 [Pseudomonas salomonii]
MPEAQLNFPPVQVQLSYNCCVIALDRQRGKQRPDFSMAFIANFTHFPTQGQLRISFACLRRNLHPHKTIVLAVALHFLHDQILASRRQPVSVRAAANHP